jgi:high-affinity Fe2+/Pb2+ permease
MKLGDFNSAAMALAMLAAFVLAAGGVKLAMKPETRSRGLLMIVAAAVLFGNVLIWTL